MLVKEALEGLHREEYNQYIVDPSSVESTTVHTKDHKTMPEKLLCLG